MGPENQRTILLVEDEAITAMAEKMALEKYGYKVITAYSGEEAAAAVKKTPAIDLILMDINLGSGMDGTEAAAVILRERDMPVVFLSSHMEPEVVEKTEKITSYGYVVKNSSITVLDASIKMAFKLFAAKIKEKEKEAALEKSELFKSKLLDKLNDAQHLAKIGSWEWDLLTNQVWWSEETYCIFGVTPQDFIPSFETNGKFIHPDDFAKYGKSFEHSFQTGEPLDIDLRMTSGDGSLKHCNAKGKIIYADSGKPLRFIGTIMDISGLKLMEESLRESKERFHAIITNTPDHIIMHDRDLRYTFVANPQLGLSAADMLGKTDRDILEKGEAEKLMAIKKKVIDTGEPFYLETSLKNLQGENEYFEGSFIPKFDSTGKPDGMIGYFRNVSERRRVEFQKEVALEALRESEQRLNFHVNNSPLAVIEWNMDFIVTRWSGEAERMFGWDHSETIGKPIMDLRMIYEEDIPIVQKTMERLSSGSSKHVISTNRNCTKQGRVVVCVWYNSVLQNPQGKIISVMSQVMDISEQRRAIEALKESELRLKAQYQGMPIATFTWQKKGEDFELIDYNDAAKIITTEKVIEFVGMKASVLYAKRRDILRDLKQCFSEGEIVKRDFSSENFIPGRDITSTFVPIPPDLVMIHIEDITERIKAAEEIKRQLTEKEILLKEVHHRIKNNIASIGGLLSLRAQSVTDTKAAAVLQEAFSRVDNIRLLYDKLLLTEDFKGLSMKNYLDDLVDKIIAIFPEHAKIKVDMAIDDFQLDPKRLFPLGSIINELLTNIMKYAFVNRKTGLIKIALAKVKKHVTLTVQDNGNGLPENFDINKSKGFGLMLVKMLSQQLGGSLSIKKQKGTMCKVEFDI